MPFLHRRYHAANDIGSIRLPGWPYGSLSQLHKSRSQSIDIVLEPKVNHNPPTCLVQITVMDFEVRGRSADGVAAVEHPQLEPRSLSTMETRSESRVGNTLSLSCSCLPSLPGKSQYFVIFSFCVVSQGFSCILSSRLFLFSCVL